LIIIISLLFILTGVYFLFKDKFHKNNV
jgi:hypothetical protein